MNPISTQPSSQSSLSSPSQVDSALREQWRAQGLHADQNLGAAFAAAAQAHPDAELVFSAGEQSETLRLADLHRRGLVLASALWDQGLRAGDTLAVQLPNSVEGVLLQRAAAALGAVFLPIVPIYGANELRHILSDAQARFLVLPAKGRFGSAVELVAAVGTVPSLARVVVIGVGHLPAEDKWVGWSALTAEVDGNSLVESTSAVGADDPALLIYTSGTTAAPKGVVHSANTLLAENYSVALRRGGPPTPQLSPWPTGHIAGLVVLLQYALLGRPTVLMQSWDPVQAARLVDRHSIVASSGTPFHLTALLDAADALGISLDTLQDYLSGAASVPTSLVQRCVERGIGIYRAYGLSEHPTVTVGHSQDPLESRLHTEGLLTLGNEIRLVDDEGNDVPSGQDGEIACRGPERFLGYRDPALNVGAFLEGGWFLTGDVGYVDAQGFLHLTDRKKDIVNRGGEKIASREVEEAMLLIPGVSDVAVVAGPDARLGERVRAFVVGKAAATLGLDAVAAHFARLGKARQKVPEQLIAVDALPRNAMGKVNKQELRARLR